MDKFKKEEKNKLLNPVDYFNFYGSFINIFQGIREAIILSETEIILPGDKDDSKDSTKITFSLDGYLIKTHKKNKYDIAIGSTISKFMLLTAVKFKGDFNLAISYVQHSLQKIDQPFIRVGTDYFKIIKKENRYGSNDTLIKSWKKDEIKQDHGKVLLQIIPKYDDFTIVPSNTEYLPVKNNCFNLYAKFPHEINETTVHQDEIPVTLQLLNHIFGDQVDKGLIYMKVLFEHPQQILPVLSLVSSERETGKTTFLNWIQMLFGENCVLINPGDLTSNFNDSYATKNIIMLDETVIDKSNVIEKLKSIATAKTMSVSQKFISNYSVPFFGKIIICTNKEIDFMRIDAEEIRFWVRKINKVNGNKNTRIEIDLFEEIPKFLKYLTQLPEIDFTRSRMVFTAEEIKTESLSKVKEESKSTLHKELEILIDDFFNNNEEINEFKATSIDIKLKWFAHNNNITASYIRTVLKDQMKIIPEKNQRYSKWGDSLNIGVGTPYHFTRQNQIEPQKVQKVPF